MAHDIRNSSKNNIFTILPEEHIQNYLSIHSQEVKRRWKELLKHKNSFSPFERKSSSDIIKEFEDLHALRQRLWYKNPISNPRVAQKDYVPAQELIEKGHYRSVTNLAFAYNNTDKAYNASTVLLRGHHFIALQEPSEGTLNQFFKLLINHHVRVLVRVKPYEEFSTKDSIKYWENRLYAEKDLPLLEMIVTDGSEPSAPVLIPYFYTNEWIDGKAMDIPSLYQLVGLVRQAYEALPEGGPIACHCAAGVGRTGTFIMAYVLFDMIQKAPNAHLSIEEIVLELSLQRPNLMGTADQYVCLYEFAEYCLSSFS